MASDGRIFILCIHCRLARNFMELALNLWQNFKKKIGSIEGLSLDIPWYKAAAFYDFVPFL